MQFELINWLAVVVCFIIGQVYLTLWFSAFFGNSWAKAYDPAKTKAEHTKEIPGYTYAIGATCTFVLVLGMALLQAAMGVKGLAAGLGLGAFISLFFVVATTIPGYVFLRRWNALALAVGSQVSLILIVSVILALWK